MLENAVTDGNLRRVKEIVETHHINLSEYDTGYNEGNLLRSAMVACKDLELVEYLVQNGCKVNLKHYLHFGPPLHWAIIIDDLGLPFVKCLMKHGANLDTVNKYGNATILLCIYKNKMDIIRYFLSLNYPEGININAILRDSYKRILNQISVRTKILLLDHFDESVIIQSLKKHINKSSIIEKYHKVLLDIRLIPGLGIDYQMALERFEKKCLSIINV